MHAYSFEHTLAVILASDFGQINLLHKTVIYLCSESLTVYIAIQNFHSTSVKNSRISKGRKFWLVLKKTPALELNHMLQGYMLLVSLIFWVSKIPITSLHHPQLSLKEIFLHSSGSQAFPFLSLPVHPESFAINYIKFNFSPPPNHHFSFFPPRFQTGHHISVLPLALSSHYFSHLSSLLSCSIWSNFNTFHHHHVSLCQ